jgi:hypothetical protein
MDIEYKLMDFHQQTGSLQVRFHNEDLPDGVVFSINLPVVNGRYPHGNDLDALIRSYAPKDIFDRAAILRREAPEAPVALPSKENVPAPPMLFGEGTLFVMDQGKRVLMTRPLATLNAIDIPVEVI